MSTNQAAKGGDALPEQFRCIRLQRAREAGHPDGDRDIGYVLIAPLTRDGRLDPDLVRAYSEHCTVSRFRPDADVVRGRLHRRPGGSWAFHYDFSDNSEDEDAGYRLGDHRFVPGEYVTIAEDDAAHTYRVVGVEQI
ncbi:MAG TPA: hypothetical protein VHC73_09265 [Vitreimonas sp.]|jgi:hypothetical protein|nr:hypothetical protein [Vitreimonas sp.]